MLLCRLSKRFYSTAPIPIRLVNIEGKISITTLDQAVFDTKIHILKCVNPTATPPVYKVLLKAPKPITTHSKPENHETAAKETLLTRHSKKTKELNLLQNINPKDLLTKLRKSKDWALKGYQLKLSLKMVNARKARARADGSTSLDDLAQLVLQVMKDEGIQMKLKSRGMVTPKIMEMNFTSIAKESVDENSKEEKKR